MVRQIRSDCFGIFKQKLMLLWLVSFCVVTATVSHGEVYRVDDDAPDGGDGLSWATAFNFIQDAVDAASTDGGGEVWVAEGTYVRQPVAPPGLDELSGQVVMMKEKVHLYGGFEGTETSRDQRSWNEHSTVIDAHFEWLDNTQYNRGVVGADNSILDGFTVTRGFVSDDVGGGMYINGVSPIISNCIFTQNTAYFDITTSFGGGMYINNASPTILDCQFINNEADICGGVYIQDASPVIAGCDFIGNRARYGDGGALYIRGGAPEIAGCLFKYNVSDRAYAKRDSGTGNKYDPFLAHGGGIYIDSSLAVISNCVFTGNESDEGGALCDRGEAFVTNCTFYGNTGSNGGAVFLTKTSSTILQNCISWRNSNEISNESEQGATVTYSCIEGGFPGEGNIQTDPLFVDALNEDFRLYAGSLCIDSGTAENAPASDIRGFRRPYGSGVDMGPYEADDNTPVQTIYHVDDDAPDGGDGMTWATAFNAIQDAVDAAFHHGGGEVWVAGGIYTATNETPDEMSTQVVEMKEGVDLYGGFAGDEISRFDRNWLENLTVIDAIYSGDYIWGGSKGVVGADHATLNGFTVMNAGSGSDGGGMINFYVSPRVENCTFDHNNVYSDVATPAGAGMYNSHSSPVIINCIFKNNNAMGAGGGMYNNSASPTITDCLFEGNEAVYGGGGGIFNSQDSSSKVTNCVFRDNTAAYWGGGIYNVSSNPSIMNCTFENNHAATKVGNGAGGGAIYNSTSSPFVLACIFTGNTVGSSYDPRFEESEMFCGGGVYNGFDSSPYFVNCIFSNNIAGYYGGGVYQSTYSSSPKFINCTFSENKAYEGGGIMTNNTNDGTITVINSIIWGGSGGAVVEKIPDTLSIEYSCIEGGYDGEGNIDSNPLFRDTTHGNYTLSVRSPCIDSGTVQYYPTIDILGTPRPHGLGYDMGAYEYYSNRPIVAPLLIILGEDLEDSDGDLNNDGFIDAADLVVWD